MLKKDYKYEFLSRLRIVLDYFYNGDVKPMASHMGFDKTSHLYNILHGRKAVTWEEFYWLGINNPEINMNWLIFGNGSLKIKF
jgi:hypothetical protein